MPLLAYLVLVIFVHCGDCRVYIKAPTGLSHPELEKVIVEYLKQNKNFLEEQLKKGHEIKIPYLPKPKVVKPTTLSRDAALAHARQILKEEEKRQAQLSRLRRMAKPGPIKLQPIHQPSYFQPPQTQWLGLRGKNPSIDNYRRGNEKKRKLVYKDDLMKALADLAQKLHVEYKKSDDDDIVHKKDLERALEDFEKKIFSKDQNSIHSTTTSNPCGPENIMEEALKPALEEDLWRFLGKTEGKKASQHNRRSR